MLTRNPGIAALLDKSFQPRMRPSGDPRQLELFADLRSTAWHEGADAERSRGKGKLVALDDPRRPRNRR
jgi:hypothetical protein